MTAPGPFGVHFKTYKAMHNDVCLCELGRPYQPTRTVRSVSSNRQEVKLTRTKAGDGSFAVAAASLRNSLPSVVKTCDVPPPASNIV